MFEWQRSWFPWNIHPLTAEEVREVLERDGRELLKYRVTESKTGPGGTVELTWRHYA